MSSTIDPTAGATGHPESEVTLGGVVALIGLTVFTFLLFLFIDPAPPREVAPLNSGIAFAPYAIAAGVTLADAITRFGGADTKPVAESTRLFALYGFLFFYVLMPTIFLFSWRKRSLPSGTTPAGRAFTAERIFLILSGVIVAFLVAASVLGAIGQRRVAANVRATHAIQENRDRIINDISAIALEAYAHRILPRSLGGGQGSFEGFEPSEELRNSPHASYTLQATDWTIRLRAESKAFQGAAVDVHVGPDASLSMWEYQGLFR